MLAAFLLALGQLGDPPIVRVLLKSLALTVVIIAGLAAALLLGAGALGAALAAPTGLAEAAAAVAAVALAWLLWRAVAIAVIGLFADEVVEAVEARHYPEALKRARPVPFGRSLRMGLGSAARAVLANLAASPVYLALLITGVGTAVAFFLVNAWLLGRDFGDMVAARHLPDEALPAFRTRTRLPRFVLGAAGTALLLVPILNLLGPLIGAAMATHLFHRRLA